MGLPTFNGDAVHIHVHGAQVEGVERSEMLGDSSANGVSIALLLFASAGQDDRDDEHRNGRDLFGFFQLSLPRIGARIVRNLRLNKLQFSNLLASLGGQICWPESDASLLQKGCGRLAAGEDPHVVVGKFLN